MRMLTDLTAELLRECLSYDEISGVFRWKICSGGRIIGAVAGTICSQGYISIGLKGGYYKAHRLAWLYVYGKWPSQFIDHINGQTGNNRIANLREATASQNLANRRANSTNKTGFKGVFYDKRHSSFIASVRIDGKTKHIGSFKTAEAASVAYRKYVTSHHGEYVHPTVALNRVPEHSRGTAEAV